MSIKKDDDFASILEASQRIPESNLDEMLSPFSAPLPRGDKFEQTKKELPVSKGVKLPYRMHIKKFVIGGMDDEDGDQSSEYEDIINKALAADYVIRFEERTITKDGLVIILLGWMTPVEKKKSVVSAPSDEEDLAILKFPRGLGSGGSE